MRFRCIGCKYLTLKCEEGKGDENHKKNCNCYDKGETTSYDLYQIVTPVAKMILWNWGINLNGDAEECSLIVYDEEIFKNKLIQELMKEGL